MIESKNESFASRTATVGNLGKTTTQRPYRQFPGLGLHPLVKRLVLLT